VEINSVYKHKVARTKEEDKAGQKHTARGQLGEVFTHLKL
jgi:hypothetical protein